MISEKQRQIGRRVKELREAKKTKQKEVADILEISVSAYAKLESGDRGLTSENCIALADYFGVTCDYILRGISAEYVDVYSGTGLEPASINALLSRKRTLTLLQNNYQEYHSKGSVLEDSAFARLENGKYVSAFEIEEEREYQICTRLYEQQTGDYLINSFLQNEKLVSMLAQPCHDAISSVVDMIYIASNYGKDFTLKEHRNRIRFDAAQYAAGQAFANFFSSLCRDADLVSSLYDLDEDDLIFAVEKGLLHYHDN